MGLSVLPDAQGSCRCRLRRGIGGASPGGLIENPPGPEPSARSWPLVPVALASAAIISPRRPRLSRHQPSCSTEPTSAQRLGASPIDDTWAGGEGVAGLRWRSTLRHADYARRRSRACYNALGGKPMKSQRSKRSIAISGHLTSISLEPPFFEALKSIATERGSTLQSLVTSIDHDRRGSPLSSALRVFVLEHYQNQIAARTPSA
jgi:predicted DNA-binding ribbon-helix-helix protein